MLKKVTSFILLALMFICISTAYSRDDIRSVKKTTLDGSETGQPYTGAKYTSTTNVDYPSVTTSFGTATFHPFGAATNYDLQSNGSTAQVWQDPITPANVHCVFMNLAAFGGTRQVVYYFSNDRGATWGLVGNVAEDAAGFPTIRGLANGNGVVAMHTNAGGGTTRAQLFVDVGPGFGAFGRLDPGKLGTGFGIWPRIAITNAQQIAFVASVNPGPPSATNTTTNIAPPGAFSGYVDYPGDAAETYSLSVAENGTIGHAYIVEDLIDQGTVRFRVSNDNGLTWVNEVTLFDANVAADSTGCLRGVYALYVGNVPYVTFSLDKLDAAGYFPTLPARIMIWSPGLNGGVPKEIAGPSNVPFAPNSGPQPGVYTPLCRPVLGKGVDNNAIFVAMNAATNVTAADSNTYFATYFTHSGDAGATWSLPERITPVTPLKDWRYVSISPTSPRTGNTYQVQLVCQNHDYAGAFAPAQPPGPADFVGIVLDVTVGVTNISSVVPGDFSLAQNFPNPFNPTTSIRFDIKKSTNVMLKVYNTNGMEIATLVDNEVVTPGTKEVSFDGANLNSGIYFYTLTAGDYTETKKMMLIK